MPMQRLAGTDRQAGGGFFKRQLDGAGFHHVAYVCGGSVGVEVADGAGVQARIRQRQFYGLCLAVRLGLGQVMRVGA